MTKQKTTKKKRTVKQPETMLTKLDTMLQPVKQRAITILLSPYRFAKTVCMIVGFVTILFFTGVGTATHLFFASLPTIDTMSFDELKQIGHDHIKGRLENKRTKVFWAPIAKIHRDLIYGTVYSEDGTFFEHDGINYEAMAKAMFANYKSNKIVSGASTITQQVAKNLFLSSEQSYLRKLKEYFIARALDDRFSKNEILEIYLNIAEYGPDLYGVRRAAWYYFKTVPTKINAGQAAYLSLMLPSPRKNHYSIFVKKQLTAKRRKKMRRVLRDMLYKEFITPKEYRRYQKSSATLAH